MGKHPVNLFVRFILEMSALLIMGIWGWNYGQGSLRYVLAFGIPLVAAFLWGVFAVPDDPSRSGKTPVPTPGLLRLLIELSFFGFAVWACHDLGLSTLWWIFGLVILIHYSLSYDRINWLIKQ